MKRSARESSGAYELSWSIDTVDQPDAAGAAGPALELELELEALEELYVGDRLWDYDKSRARTADREGVYRFVHDGALRLVFARAPSPSNVMPRVVYEPLFSRVEAGQKHRRRVTLGLPVHEYSSLARDMSEPTSLVEVERVTPDPRLSPSLEHGRRSPATPARDGRCRRLHRPRAQAHRLLPGGRQDPGQAADGLHGALRAAWRAEARSDAPRATPRAAALSTRVSRRARRGPARESACAAPSPGSCDR
jgi:hypothetical protein